MCCNELVHRILLEVDRNRCIASVQLGFHGDDNYDDTFFELSLELQSDEAWWFDPISPKHSCTVLGEILWPCDVIIMGAVGRRFSVMVKSNCKSDTILRVQVDGRWSGTEYRLNGFGGPDGRQGWWLIDVQ